jgi:hypothetical protein
MEYAGAVDVDIFEPVRAAACAGGRIDPGISLAGMLGQSGVHEQGGAGDERRIQAHALAALFPVNVESQVVHFPAGLPQEHNAVCAGVIFAELGGERFQLDAGWSGDDFGL